MTFRGDSVEGRLKDTQLDPGDVRRSQGGISMALTPLRIL